MEEHFVRPFFDTFDPKMNHKKWHESTSFWFESLSTREWLAPRTGHLATDCPMMAHELFDLSGG